MNCDSCKFCKGKWCELFENELKFKAPCSSYVNKDGENLTKKYELDNYIIDIELENEILKKALELACGKVLYEYGILETDLYYKSNLSKEIEFYIKSASEIVRNGK